VDAGPVAAAFYNFHPAMVAKAVPACWDVVAPGTLCRVRAIAAAEALGEVCRTEARSALLASLPLLRRAAEGCDGAGRVMAGANRSLWPRIATALGTGGLGEVWQACTTLREHRGDGHVAALAVHGLSGLQAHVLAAGSKGVAVELLRDNRGWSEAEWEGATASLTGDGLLHADGRVTDAGRTLHGLVEDLTDELAEPAYAALSDQALVDLHGALGACAVDVAASGLVPFPNPMGLPRPGPR
jgi:Helix-turn-helix family